MGTKDNIAKLNVPSRTQSKLFLFSQYQYIIIIQESASVMFCRGKTRVIQTHHLHEGSWSRDRCSHYDVIYLRTLYSQHSLRATKPSDLCRRESVHRQNTGTKIKEDIFMKHLAKREFFKDTAKCQNTQFKVNKRYSCNGCNRQQRYFISVRSPVSNSGTRFCKQLKILFFYTFQTCSVYSVSITSDTLKNFVEVSYQGIFSIF